MSGKESARRDDQLFRIRHSLAHVLAQAVQKYRPGTKLGFGPATDDGFFYDFFMDEPLTPEDLPAIEDSMRAIIKEKQAFSHEDLPLERALVRIRDEMGEDYKAEFAREMAEKEGLGELRFYTNGPFVDMCEGPHVESTAEIPVQGFKLIGLSGAYWRGNENNPMMVRVSGWAFQDKKELKKYEQAREEALKRDHRKLGAELDIFVIDEDVGKGLPLWLPAGAIMCQELEKLAREWEFLDGYVPVRTPHLTKGGLYEISGHLALYKEGMYPKMEIEGEDYYLKPMNCPHHHKIYAARPRSYRDLPLRLAEYGTCYRNERSGTLQGLTRVRGLCMNDAHIYCAEEQIEDEFRRVMDLHRRYYDLFGLSDYYFRLSAWDPEDPKGREKYVNDPAGWEKTERLVQAAMDASGLPYTIEKGEAAFYGPKIDVQFKTVGLREFTVSTNQLDFAVAGRFGLTYVAKDGSQKTPYIIHRAPLSTHERFISFLIEHYGGAMPTWLAPEQVRILPVADSFAPYADTIAAALRQRMVRAEVDHSDATLGKKIRSGATRKVPILLVVGEKEMEESSVTVRRRGIQEQRSMPLAQFLGQIEAEIRDRKHVVSWDDAPAA